MPDSPLNQPRPGVLSSEVYAMIGSPNKVTHRFSIVEGLAGEVGY